MENYDDDEPIVITPDRPYEAPRIEEVRTLTPEEAEAMRARMTGNTLLGSADGQLWAQEFCRIFSGKVVNGDTVDEGLMIGWFANAIEVGKAFALRQVQTDPIYWAFLQNFHLDKGNACVHCAPVRFSPVTFRLSELLCDLAPTLILDSAELAEVRDHAGKYAEDIGR